MSKFYKKYIFLKLEICTNYKYVYKVEKIYMTPRKSYKQI